MAVNIIILLIGLWNLTNAVGVGLFLYYAYGVKDDFVLRRYPILTCLQIFCLNVWVNCLIQRSGLHFTYAVVNNAMNNPMAGYVVTSFTCPLYITTLVIKGFSLTTEYFSTRKLMLDSTANKFDWYRDLTPLEQRFLWLQQRILSGTRVGGDHHVEDKEIGGGSTTGSHHGSGHGIMRRYGSSMIRRALAYTFVVSLVMFFLGLIIAGCFPPLTKIPQCANPPYYLRCFIPLMIFNLMDLLFIPVLLYLLRNIHDVHYIRNETLFNYCLIVTIFIAQLIVDLPPLPFFDPLRGFFFQLVGLPITSLTMLYFPVYCCWRNQQHLKRKSISVQHTPEVFEKILKDRHMMEELKKVLEESYCLENGFFWTDFQDATRLHTSRSSTDAEKANIVRKLYKNYIQAGAPRELNLHGGTSAALTKAYKANRLTIESFEPVRAEVFTMLYMNSFPKLIEHIKSSTSTLSRTRMSGFSNSAAPATSGF